GEVGGSVAHALIASDRPYRLQELSRDITKPVAQKFAEQGVEIVNVTLAVEKPEAASKAFADIVFASMCFVAAEEFPQEPAVGKLLVDATKDSGVKLFVWSSFE
ncbi:hypothetical protein B0H10DRAFT_1769512, partial [Mycena sp. CBHHK59/15]